MPKGVRDVVPVAEMAGDSAEDTGLLQASFDTAEKYLRGFQWCIDIREAHFGLGVGGVVAVFLFNIEAASDVDDWLWVVVGDVPSAYLVIDDAKEPAAALRVYCDLMMDWADAVEAEGDFTAVFPIDAPATRANAAALRKRIAMLREMFELRR